MASRTVSVALRAEVSGYMASLRSASAETKRFGDSVLESATKNRAELEHVGRGLMGVGAAALAGLGLATKAAIDWETAWAGVTKTVDGSAQEMAQLEGELRDMAKSLPATHEEIAAVAEAAGQLGVQREHIAEFTKTMIDLGETTNLSAEEAATSLARFSNIMGTSQGDVDRLGSVLVDLGNNAATTEAEILTLGTRLAAAGEIAGLTESDVLAFASTLTSVGVEAEAGGTALSKVFTSVRDAVIDGSDKLDVFAKVAGSTASDFARAFEEDPARAISTFIAGLGRMNESGQSTTAVFEQLELTDQRLMRALLSTASAGDLLAQQLDRGKTAWEENTALTEEAQKRYETAAAQIQMAWNSIKDAAIDVGAAIVPVVTGIASTIGDLADAFGKLPGPVKTALAAVAGIGGALSLVGGAALLMLPRIAETRAAMQTLGITTSAVGGKLRGFARFAGGPWGLAIGGAVTALSLWAQSKSELSRKSDELLDIIGDEIDLTNRAADGYDRLSEATRKAFAENLISEHEDLLDVLDETGASLDDLVRVLLGDTGPAYDRIQAAISDVTVATRAGRDGFQEAGDGAVRLGEILDAEGAVVEAAARKQEHLNTVTDGGAESADGAGDAYAGMGDEAADAAEQIQELLDTISELNGEMLDARAAARGYEAALDDANETIKENGRNLDITTKKGRENQAALDDLATAALESAEATLRNAQENGNLDAVLPRVQRKLQQQRKDFINAAVAAGMERDRARELARRLINIPEDVRTSIHTNAHAAMSDVDWLRRQLDALDGRTATVTVRSVLAGTGPTETNMLLSSTAAGADGGLVAHGDIRRFDNGGPVVGLGGPRDDKILARLSNGEFVVNADATSRHRSLLEAINSNRFANGGAVMGAPRVSVPVVQQTPAAGGGLTVEHLEVTSVDGRFSTRQVMDDLAMHSAA